MGETAEWLRANGGPGMFLCGRTGQFVVTRCADEHGQCILDNENGCAVCDEECPPWQPDGEGG